MYIIVGTRTVTLVISLSTAFKFPVVCGFESGDVLLHNIDENIIQISNKIYVILVPTAGNKKAILDLH